MKKIALTSILDQVDKVISVAKMKTHSFMVVTGGVKKLFGLIVGKAKAQFHLRMKKRSHFAGMLVDLAQVVKPVRCYCCQELCPADAVELKRGFLLKIFRKGNH